MQNYLNLTYKIEYFKTGLNRTNKFNISCTPVYIISMLTTNTGPCTYPLSIAHGADMPIRPISVRNNNIIYYINILCNTRLNQKTHDANEAFT